MYTVVVRAHVSRLDADALPGAQGYYRCGYPGMWGKHIVQGVVFALLSGITYLLFGAIKLSRVLTEDESCVGN